MNCSASVEYRGLEGRHAMFRVVITSNCKNSSGRFDFNYEIEDANGRRTPNVIRGVWGPTVGDKTTTSQIQEVIGAGQKVVNPSVSDVECFCGD